MSMRMLRRRPKKNELHTKGPEKNAGRAASQFILFVKCWLKSRSVVCEKYGGSKQDVQCTYNVRKNWGAFANHCCRGKSISIIYWSVRACVHIALLIQQATCMRHIVTSFVAPRSPPTFPVPCHKRCDFRKNVTEHKMCVLIFSTIFV